MGNLCTKFLQYSIFLVRYSLFFPTLLISNIEQGIKNKEVEIFNPRYSIINVPVASATRNDVSFITRISAGNYTNWNVAFSHLLFLIFKPHPPFGHLLQKEKERNRRFQYISRLCIFNFHFYRFASYCLLLIAYCLFTAHNQKCKSFYTAQAQPTHIPLLPSLRQRIFFILGRRWGSVWRRPEPFAKHLSVLFIALVQQLDNLFVLFRYAPCWCTFFHLF